MFVILHVLLQSFSMTFWWKRFLVHSAGSRDVNKCGDEIATSFFILISTWEINWIDILFHEGMKSHEKQGGCCILLLSEECFKVRKVTCSNINSPLSKWFTGTSPNNGRDIRHDIVWVRNYMTEFPSLFGIGNGPFDDVNESCWSRQMFKSYSLSPTQLLFIYILRAIYFISL